MTQSEHGGKTHSLMFAPISLCADVEAVKNPSREEG